MTEVKALTVVDSVRKMEGEFKMALPAHIPSDRFTRIAVSAINGNPELLANNIDKRSLYASVMKAAQDGLVIDGREAALVTFNVKGGGKAVQYMPMVAGIMKKMRNTGEIATISYGLVYQREFDEGRFEYVKGDSESLTHKPILFGDKGDFIGVYAVVTLKDGSKIREFMDMGQIEKVRAVSRAAKSEYGPWTKWFEEMAAKSVLRKVSKLCPMSSDIDAMFKREDDDNGFDAETGEIHEEKPKRTGTRAAAKVKDAAANTMKAAVDEGLIDQPADNATIIDDAEYSPAGGDDYNEELPV